MARMVAEGIGRTLGQPVVVENMPGASGIVAHQAVARAAPDGYTLLFTNTSGMAINPVSFKQLPYNPARDFTPIAMVCSLGPQMLSVNADLPVASAAEFMAYAKANRGKLSVAFDTTAGAAAFAAKLLNRRADLGLIEVAYRSSGQMTQDVASGIVPVMISSVVAANAIVQAGKVRRLAITSEERFPGLPGSAGPQRDGARRCDERLVQRCCSHRHPGRHRRAPQPRDRRIPQGTRNSATAAIVRPCDRRRRHAGEHRPIHQATSRSSGARWQRSSTSFRNDAASMYRRASGAIVRSQPLSYAFTSDRIVDMRWSATPRYPYAPREAARSP